jgi:protease I
VTASTGVDVLKEAGAIFTGAPVERDGLIITANGPAAARQFGEAIAAALVE